MRNCNKKNKLLQNELHHRYINDAKYTFIGFYKPQKNQNIKKLQFRKTDQLIFHVLFLSHLFSIIRIR